jgi:exodeoxyribonuclease V alpha subunit
VIVDESSMIDLALFHALLSGLDPGTSLVLTGDVDQLPSVGPGRVLDDLIRSGRIRVVRLEEIFRQKRESRIVINAHRIHRGLLPESATGAALSDFYFIEREHPLEARRLLVRLVKEEIPRKFGLDPRTEIQVLTPMHKGICGGVALNACLKLALNPRQETLLPDDDGERDPGDAPPELEDVAWNETEETFLPHNAFFDPGDRVMQIRNDYEKEVFNGDVGTVVAAADGGGIVIDFDGRHVAYAPDERDQLLPAYAITVHKAQGSEYPCVVLPLTLEHRVMLQRNLLYTGVTRAKSLVILVGSKEALRIAVENRRDHGRFSGLRGRLSASPAHSPSRESPSSS